MATRMTTLLYGERPGADVAPGNRADAEDDPGASGTHPRLLPTIEVRAVEVEAAAEPTAPAPLRAAELEAAAEPAVPAPLPTYPRPDPWLEAPGPLSAPSALPAMMLGLATAAAIFAGLAIWGVAFAWSQSLSRLGQLGLMALGGYLIAVGIAYLLPRPAA